MEMAMVQSEERPSKIRKLDFGLEDDLISELAPTLDIGVLKKGANATSSTENDAAKALASASKGNHIVSSSPHGDGDAGETEAPKSLSKNQLKKLVKKQNWEEGRDYRKAKRREKTKQKKIRKAEARATLDPQGAEDATMPAIDPPPKSSQRPLQLPITFVLDCDFDNLMTEAELISLGAQLTRCYSDNKSAQFRAHLVVSSFGGKLKQRFETVLASNHLGWKGVKFTADDFVTAATEADTMMRSLQGGQLVGAFASGIVDVATLQHSTYQTAETFQPVVIQSSGRPAGEIAIEGTTSEAEQPATEIVAAISTEQTYAATGVSVGNDSDNMVRGAFPEELNASSDIKALKYSRGPSIVYLTSDSPHTLDVLSPYTSYVIGGIVDKNRHKGICYKRAMTRDIPTAKLPIGEYMTMQSRSVLTTNHVAEIMLRWLEYGDWAKAFLQVIPKRKEARLKAKPGTANNVRDTEDGHASSGSEGD